MDPILIVDDEAATRLFLKNLIAKKTDYPVLEASTGEEALAIWPRQAVSGFVIDLSMPIMSGTELIEHIRSRPEGAMVPIIVVSCQNIEEYKTTLQRSQVRHIFGKLEIMDHTSRHGQEEFLKTLKKVLE